MLSDIAKLLTAGELLLLVFAIGYILIFKRDALDPRLYVLYGIFHWLFVGQFYYVFGIGTYFDFEVYEPMTFSEAEVMAGTLLIFVSTCVFLLGYAITGWQYNSRSRWASNASSEISVRLRAGFGRRLLFVSFLMFLIASLAIYLFEGGLFSFPVSLFLPIGYLMPVASLFLVIGIVSHCAGPEKMPRVWLTVSVLLLLYMAVTSNIVSIYPLVAICVLFASRFLPKMNRVKIVSLIFATPIVIFFAMSVQLAGKIYRRLQMSGVDIGWSSFYNIDIFRDYLWKALLTLDSFNTESFGIVLQSLRDFVDNDNYLYGSSILSAVPMFKLYGDDEFQSFGRVFALKSLGVDLDSNTAMAVSPIAEMAVNFSYIGSLIFYFAIGIITAISYEKFKKSRSFTSLPVYIIFLVWIFLQQRGDFLNGNMYPAYVLLVTYFVAHIFGRKKWTCPLHSNRLPNRSQ